MKIQELIDYLRQFDPEREVWVTYDGIAAYEPDFRPATGAQATAWHSEGVHPGDLIMEVG